jgi:hypothetical protein
MFLYVLELCKSEAKLAARLENAAPDHGYYVQV